MADEIKIVKADSPIRPGKYYKFYIRGEYRGSAQTNLQARRAAMELLGKMQTKELICDRCKKEYTDESCPVEHFYVRVGGVNYVEDDVVRDKDYCRSCIAHIRRMIAASLTTVQNET